jgi:hypothetical protein
MRSPTLDVVRAERAREDRVRSAPARSAEPARASVPGIGPPTAAAEEPSAMLAAEHELEALKQCFEQSDDPQTRGALALSALEAVERQLHLARERRHELDGVEGRLWARRNRIERFLIGAKGRDWWHEHSGALRGRT